MEKTLKQLGLSPNNSVVTGSGILQVLNIRKSNDMDLVVTKEVYDNLKSSGKYKFKKKPYGNILVGENIDIRKNWKVLGKDYDYSSIKGESMVIEGVRYLTLDFIYRVKRSWVEEKTARPKDIKDVDLIERYKTKQKQE